MKKYFHVNVSEQDTFMMGLKHMLPVSKRFVSISYFETLNKLIDEITGLF